MGGPVRDHEPMGSDGDSDIASDDAEGTPEEAVETIAE